MPFKTFLVKFFVIFFIQISTFCLSQELSPISPENGLIINNDSILMRWNTLANAQYYELKFTSDSNFISNITTINVGLQNAYWLTPLLSNTTYYWRIEGNNGANTEIGQTRKFTNFKPTDFSGCNLWLRADTGITLVGSKVQGWADASPNLFAINQTTVNYQPTFLPNYINGLPALKFDGGDLLTVDNFPYGATVQGFIICRKPSPVTPNCQYLTGPNFNFEIINYYCSVELTVGLVGIFSSLKWNQISLIRKSGASKANLNGVEFGTTPIGVNPISPGKMTIGNRDLALNASAGLQGEISEIVVNTSVLNDFQIKTIETYLMDRYTPKLTLGADTNITDNFCPISLNASPGFVNYLWSTGDTGITTTVSTSGIYYVQATDIFDRIHIDTIVVSYPQFQQLNTTTLCIGNQITWNTNLPATYTFVWQDGSALPYYNITQAGAYYLHVTDNFGCSYSSDTINIDVDNFSAIVSIGNDTSLCAGNTIQLVNGANTAVNFLWSNGSVNDSLIITNAGVYWLEVSNINNCIARDTINISLTGLAPVSLFSSQNVCEGLPMQFNDLSFATGDVIVGWEWSFGDGNFSVLQNPTYDYLNPGIYTVTLKAISSSGCASLSNQTMQVFNHPAINFTTINNCDGANASFANTTNAFGGVINSLSWNFNDPFSTSNVASGSQVNHTYNQLGTYTVSLIVTTAEGCIDTLLKPISIKPSPIAAFEHSKLCVGDSVHFKDISLVPFPQQNLTRQWIFNDTIFLNNFEPKQWYENAGDYPVKLIIMISNGCKDSLEDIITINNIPNAAFSIDKTCEGMQSLMIDTSSCENCQINSWKWMVNNNLLDNNDTVAYTFNDTGNYVIQLEVENQGNCKAIIQKTIHVNETPEALFDADKLFGSPPLNVNFINNSLTNLFYNWSFGDGSFDTSFEPQHSFIDTGDYTVKLVVFDNNFCSDSASINIKVLPVRIDLGVTNASIEIKDNYLYSEVTLINLGTVAIHSFDIFIKTNGMPNNFIEHWEGMLLPGTVVYYTLKNSFKQNEEYGAADFMCYDFLNINNDVDRNLANNNICTALKLDNFKFAGLYPNPLEDFLNLNLISPYDENVLIEFIDYKGSVIFSKTEKVSKGFNLINIETMNLQAGIYSCRINYRNSYHLQSFVKINK
jgi:PKD repeat protein